jgi:hypothetical protein
LVWSASGLAGARLFHCTLSVGARRWTSVAARVAASLGRSPTAIRTLYDEAIAKRQKFIELDPRYAAAYDGWRNVPWAKGKHLENTDM